MGGRRPAGAERVDVPESNTLLLMPRISLSAVVRDRINGANGLIPSNGFPLGQQLETVKAGHLPPQLTRRGIDQKICKQLLYLRRTRHRAAQASSTQRLRGAMPGSWPWSWRYRRLRAHFRLLFFWGGSSFNDGTTQTARDPLMLGGRLAPLKSVYFGSNEGRGPQAVPSVQP